MNNGSAEPINGRVQMAKVRAKGYGIEAHLISISNLVCAMLKHLPKNPMGQRDATDERLESQPHGAG